MKIICIYAGVSYYQQKLDYIFNVFRETLGELGVSITIVNVSQINLPYFDGRKNNTIQNITDSIKTSQAIIFATTAQKLSVCGAMQVFLEHLDYELYGEVLKNKPCISIVTSLDNSECMAGNYLNNILGSLEVISSNNMLVGEQYLQNIENSQEVKQIIEKYAEDFYRVIKQNRKFFIAKPFKSNVLNNNLGNNSFNNSITSNNQNNLSNNNFNNNNNNNFNNNYNYNYNTQDNQMLNSDDFKRANDIKNINANNYNSSSINSTPNNNNASNNQMLNRQISDLYKKETEKDDFSKLSNLSNNNISNNNISNNNINNNNINNQASFTQESLTDNYSNLNNNYSSSDIPQIAQNIQDQYKSEKGMMSQYLDNPDNTQVIPQNIEMPVHKGTLKQKTQSLYHYFQPQISQGLDISMQVMITGFESFNGYFLIKNSECLYIEGIHNDASVYIMSDASVWEEIITGKCTLQKAFMLGRLKVKGNFVIISRFEQFFKVI